MSSNQQRRSSNTVGVAEVLEPVAKRTRSRFNSENFGPIAKRTRLQTSRANTPQHLMPARENNNRHRNNARRQQGNIRNEERQPVVMNEASKETASLPEPKSLAGSSNPLDVLKCAICLETYVDNRPLVTRCGHIYCGMCIVKWMVESNSKCPKCKTKLSPSCLTAVFL